MINNGGTRLRVERMVAVDEESDGRNGQYDHKNRSAYCIRQINISMAKWKEGRRVTIPNVTCFQ